jgi:hypothetical protein
VKPRGLGSARRVVRMKRLSNAYNCCSDIPVGKMLLVSPEVKQGDDTKMDMQELIFQGLDCIHKVSLPARYTVFIVHCSYMFRPQNMVIFKEPCVVAETCTSSE